MNHSDEQRSHSQVSPPATPTIEDGDLPETQEKQNERTSEEILVVVDWEGPDDPQNPKNWTYKRKWAATIIISMFTFISPVSSSMVAPASNQIAHDFNINSTALIEMTTSVFLLGFAVGPLVLGPLSEIYGRSRVLQLANLFYLVWNLACGFSRNTGQLIAFRLLSGLGGSAPLAIGGGALGDMWRPEERGKAISIYSLAPLLGPVIGPICGAWIADRSTWRWVYWSTTLIDALVQVAGVLFLQETFAPLLLERKAKALRQQQDPEKSQNEKIVTVYEKDGDRSWKRIFARAMTRPFALLAFEPIIQLLAIYMAYIYGLLYLFLTSIPSIFSNVYHESPGIAGLHYLALGIGLVGGAQINARSLDRIYIHLKNKNGGVGEPEFRLLNTFVGSLLIPIGLFIAGWAAECHVHWIVTDIGMVLIGGGVISVFQSIQTYVIDSFTLYAASALAAIAVLRSVAGFGFPLFAPTMYEALGYGKGNTILACSSIVLGWPAAWIFWTFGKRIRASSRHARKSS
ncbi:MFS polyamine transporter [Amanita muscaria]